MCVCVFCVSSAMLWKQQPSESFWVICAGLTCQINTILLVHKMAKQPHKTAGMRNTKTPSQHPTHTVQGFNSYEALREFQRWQLPSAKHKLISCPLLPSKTAPFPECRLLCNSKNIKNHNRRQSLSPCLYSRCRHPTYIQIETKDIPL